MANVGDILTDNLGIWTSAIERRSSAGRGRSKKFSLYGIEKLRALVFDLAAIGKIIDAPAVTPTKLGKHVELVMGQAPPGDKCNTSGTGTIFVKAGEFGPLYPEIIEWTTSPLKMAKLGDVLICVVGATIGKLNLAIDCAIGRSVAAIRPRSHIDTKFLYYSLFPYTIRLRSGSRGSAQGVIGKDDLNAIAVRVPPLAEQQRIVAKVDELMALCDALEAETYQALEAHELLVANLLATLTRSADANELSENWTRIETHFDTLFTTEASIDQLKQTILQLAVMGKLVPQDPNDEPATGLIRRLHAARTQLIQRGEAKRTQALQPITQTETPFAIPRNWQWVHFEDVTNPAYAISYGVLVPGENEEGGIPFVRIADLSISLPSERPEKSISPEIDAQYERTRLIGGEILMGVVGSIGKLGIAPESWRGANIARAVCRIVPSDMISKEYIIWLLQSDFMQSNFRGNTRTLAQPTLNINLIRSSLTPLPPVGEQRRIAEKVAQLYGICEALKARLAERQRQQIQFADAVVSKAVA
jgi:type I restriction enzyme S subunit